jgi:hypothetical protein
MKGVVAMTKFEVATSLAALIVASTGIALAQQAPPTGAAPAPAIKMAAGECQAIWNKADSGKAGSLTSSQAQPYVKEFKAVDSNGDGKLSSAEFLAGCQKGLAHDSASSGASSGTSGADKDNPPGKVDPSKDY